MSNGQRRKRACYADSIGITRYIPDPRSVYRIVRVSAYVNLDRARQFLPTMSDTSTSTPSDGSRFLNRVRTACRRKAYSYRTEKTYLRWIVRYVKYHGTRHPGAFGKQEVRAYLSYLATER